MSLHRRAKFNHGVHSVVSLLLPDEQGWLDWASIVWDGFSWVQCGTIITHGAVRKTYSLLGPSYILDIISRHLSMVVA